MLLLSDQMSLNQREQLCFGGVVAQRASVLDFRPKLTLPYRNPKHTRQLPPSQPNQPKNNPCRVHNITSSQWRQPRQKKTTGTL